MGGMAIFSLSGQPILPLESECMIRSTAPFESNRMNGLIAYHNNGFGVKIFNAVAGLKLERFKLVANRPIQIELPPRLHGHWGQLVLHNSLIVGGVGHFYGLRLAGYHRWTVNGTTFANFSYCGSFGTSLACSCAVVNFNGWGGGGGWITRFAKTTWLNAPMRTGAIPHERPIASASSHALQLPFSLRPCI